MPLLSKLGMPIPHPRIYAHDPTGTRFRNGGARGIPSTPTKPTSKPVSKSQRPAHRPDPRRLLFTARPPPKVVDEREREKTGTRLWDAARSGKASSRSHLPDPRRFLFTPRPTTAAAAAAADEREHETTATRLWNGACTAPHDSPNTRLRNSTITPLQKIQHDIALLRQKMKALKRKAYQGGQDTGLRLRVADDGGICWGVGSGDLDVEREVREVRRGIRARREEGVRERMKLDGRRRWVDGERGWVGLRCEDWVEKVGWEDPFL